MARLRVVIAHDPVLLLRRAADEFLVRRRATPSEPFPTVPCLLALRQGGLRDDLLGMAAEAGLPGWFDPPLCIFHELPRWLGAPERDVIGEYERFVLVGRILRREEGGVFARLARPDDFADAVDALFGELLAEGVPPAQLERALAARGRGDDFERRRDAELARAYAAYVAELARIGKGDGRDEWAHCAAAIADGRADVARALGGRRDVRIFGLQDLRGGWKPLLAALAGCGALDSVAIYTSVALPLDDLGAEVERLAEPAAMASSLFRGDAGRAERTASLLVAPDTERELDEIARRVRVLIDGGVEPRRIAIVSRKARPHADLALASLGRFGIPATARQRVALAEIPVVRAVRALFDGAADGWTRHSLVEIAAQPYLACGLDAGVLDHLGYRQALSGLEAWEIALRRLEARAREREAAAAEGADEDARRHPLPPAARVTATREAFGRFASRARQLDRRRPLLEWLRWLAELLRHDPWRIARRIHDVPGDELEIARRDLAGWNALIAIVDEWSAALGEFDAGGEVLGAAEFHAQLRACLDGDVALWTPVQQGVQVLESLAAAYRGFEHVFVVGMQAGAFPAARPRSPILDDAEREQLAALGVPLERREAWEERERELFRVLIAGARTHLTLSYARLDDDGRDVIGSAFVEALGDVATLDRADLPAHEVLIHGVPVVRDDRDAAQALHAARIERLRETGTPSPWNGQVRDGALLEWLATEFGDDRLWSPTQLEEFAKCPWAFFSKRLLRIEQREDPDDELAPSVRGTVLHDALHRFYDAARALRGGPVFLVPDDADWALPLLDDAVAAAMDAEGARGWLGHPSLHDARRAELARIGRDFLQWEMQLHHDMTDPKTRKRNAPAMIRTGVEAHEVAFDEMVYEHEGIRIRYRGTIDRVEVSVDERIPEARFVAAADYKTTKSSTPGKGDRAAWDDGVVLQVPLYAYALSHLRPSEELARIGYLIVKKPELVQALELYRYDRKQQAVESQDDAQDRWREALGAAIGHVRRARAGEFPADPPPSCGCPPWCHAREICRVKGGPESR